MINNHKKLRGGDSLLSKKIFYSFIVLYIAIVLTLNYMYNLENITLTWLFGIFLLIVIIFKYFIPNKVRNE
ncbi:hypothetical protein [Saliterribacillus persicus]|uniref:Uncharacterized protein n=1 Tax=Saliterribacillus persicus TaxID=930114 RepID=A0A368Y9L5_9BACI|nr:hypothetical protein [Saliterribacillus persicus]RCW76961.1 hypothetical protein DFR57_102236 [Saliterribacillus persicus]